MWQLLTCIGLASAAQHTIASIQANFAKTLYCHVAASALNDPQIYDHFKAIVENIAPTTIIWSPVDPRLTRIAQDCGHQVMEAQLEDNWLHIPAVNPQISSYSLEPIEHSLLCLASQALLIVGPNDRDSLVKLLEYRSSGMDQTPLTILQTIPFLVEHETFSNARDAAMHVNSIMQNPQLNHPLACLLQPNYLPYRVLMTGRLELMPSFLEMLRNAPVIVFLQGNEAAAEMCSMKGFVTCLLQTDLPKVQVPFVMHVNGPLTDLGLKEVSLGDESDLPRLVSFILDV